MLLTLTTTRPPATDLGWLLHKHPAKVQMLELAFGRAHVFYPEATERRCTAALLLDVDPIGLVRRRGGPAGEGFSLQQYVNDRPYVGSSFMSVAIAQVYGSALGGRCNDRPELVNEVFPLEAHLAVLPCRGGEVFLRRLFEPLGYEVSAERHALDAKFTDWGDSSYFTVTLRGKSRLRDLLTHLYVLIPVLDNDKHYWVGDDEVDKLLRRGEGWLAAHPEREAITRRYLKHQWSLAREALARLAEEDQPDPDAEHVQRELEEETLEAQVQIAAAAQVQIAAVAQVQIEPRDDAAGDAVGPDAMARDASPSDATARAAAGAGLSRAVLPDDAGTSISDACAPTDAGAAFSDDSMRADAEIDSADRPERGPTLNTLRLATVLAALRGCQAQSVVDVGCGEGKLLRLLLDDQGASASGRPQFERIVGMDVSLRSLKIAAERLRLERRRPSSRRARHRLAHAVRPVGFGPAVPAAR
ncbi:MAG: 3' terminal RNA ribose 2'-O-methyltransferase Hen1 [Phycisphaerales bacterium]|nr:3' terminal RNA ribose 2'-O-methyltransferase Hen1 [Phycisphaerales bacterium]